MNYFIFWILFFSDVSSWSGKRNAVENEKIYVIKFSKIIQIIPRYKLKTHRKNASFIINDKVLNVFI